MTHIIINGVEYKGVTVNALSLESEVTEHAVEEVEIAEHVALRAPAFRLDMAFYDQYQGSGNIATLVSTREEQFKTIRDLWLLKAPFTFECQFRIFNDMIVTSFEPQENVTSLTAFPLTLTIRQIITVELIPIETQVLVDEDGTIIGGVPAGSTVTEVTLTTPEAVTEGENKSLLENLWGWITGT